MKHEHCKDDVCMAFCWCTYTHDSFEPNVSHCVFHCIRSGRHFCVSARSKYGHSSSFLRINICFKSVFAHLFHLDFVCVCTLCSLAQWAEHTHTRTHNGQYETKQQQQASNEMNGQHNESNIWLHVCGNKFSWTKRRKNFKKGKNKQRNSHRWHRSRPSSSMHFATFNVFQQCAPDDDCATMRCRHSDHSRWRRREKKNAVKMSKEMLARAARFYFNTFTVWPYREPHPQAYIS